MHAFGPATSYPLSAVEDIPQPVIPENKIFRRKGGTVSSLELAWEWVW